MHLSQTVGDRQTVSQSDRRHYHDSSQWEYPVLNVNASLICSRREKEEKLASTSLHSLTTAPSLDEDVLPPSDYTHTWELTSTDCSSVNSTGDSNDSNSRSYHTAVLDIIAQMALACTRASSSSVKHYFMLIICLLVTTSSAEQKVKEPRVDKFLIELRCPLREACIQLQVGTEQLTVETIQCQMSIAR